MDLAPPGLTTGEAPIEGIPLYDDDLEAEQGVPEAAERLEDRIAAADGLLIVTPEYDNPIPGVVKNALDWPTRPPQDIGRVFGERPVRLIGATAGRGGTRVAQTAWLPVFRTLGMRPFFGKRPYVAGAEGIFDGELRLTDETIWKHLREYLEPFARFVDVNRRRV